MNKSGGCLAIIPARGGSKGLPGKNIRPLDGKPLIVYSIEAALLSGCVDEVMVTTDSPAIADIARSAGARIPFMRPDHLASDQSKSIDVLRHAISFYEENLHRTFSSVLLLQPTSPLRDQADIRKAFKQFEDSGAESLQSVCPAATHPYLLRTFEGGRLSPYWIEQPHLRRQDLQEVYALNGAIYIMKRDLVMERNSIVGDHNTGYVMPKERSIDIDDLLDFQIAEILIRKYRSE
ncbi:flagellar modification protein B [Saccharibacillus sp. O23]|uniref:acylneuraminate cytidylyltransferase family protein n=1 Tax=Saccharibacillus sp. O23 TaxID=2009338 RepID=UPI000B4E0EAB|nr:acylneuraminate cytidylyltransferase family protein [Saccharibacillus sp. O23]OWR27593.1 flagellar modification protein B [Saccharibacillus sp. O23]